MRRLSIAARLTVLVTVICSLLGVPLVLFGQRAVEGILVNRAFADHARTVLEPWTEGVLITSDTVGAGVASEAVEDDDYVRALVELVVAIDAAHSGPARELDERIGRTRGDPILVLVEDGRLLDVSSTTARLASVDPDRLAVSEWDLFEIAYQAMLNESAKQGSFEFRRYGTRFGQPVLIGVETTDLIASAEGARSAMGWLLPPFVAMVALATWWLTRRALRPVGEMTRRVGEISHRGPLAGERLPVPRARDEPALLAVQMNDLLDRIGAGAIAQRAFTADAGHELRSPLAVLRSEHEQAIARSAGVPNVLAERSLPEIDRLERIVEDLLELARADEARGPAVVTEVDVDDVVFCEADRRRRVPVDVRQVGAAKAMADAESVRRVVQHLLDNAARHASTTVAVALRQDGPGAPAVLTVDDDGVGIPPDQRSRVFERFVRLDDARSRGSGGAGLGLSVVAELVGHLGGTVTIGESPLGGARFEVSLIGADVGDTRSDTAS